MTTRTCAILVSIVLMLAALLVVLGGCLWSRPVAKPTTPHSQPAASTAPTSSASSSTAEQGSTPKVDASGAAIGTPLTISGKAKPQVGSIARPSDATAVEQAKKVIDATEGAQITAATVVAMTQDGKGDWWVLLNLTDAGSGKEKAVLTYDGKTWSEGVFGSDVTNSDLPDDVRF